MVSLKDEPGRQGVDNEKGCDLEDPYDKELHNLFELVETQQKNIHYCQERLLSHWNKISRN